MKFNKVMCIPVQFFLCNTVKFYKVMWSPVQLSVVGCDKVMQYILHTAVKFRALYLTEN